VGGLDTGGVGGGGGVGTFSVFFLLGGFPVPILPLQGLEGGRGGG